MTTWKIKIERSRQYDRGWVQPHERTRCFIAVDLPMGITDPFDARHHPLTVARLPKGHRTIDARPWKEAA